MEHKTTEKVWIMFFTGSASVERNAKASWKHMFKPELEKESYQAVYCPDPSWFLRSGAVYCIPRFPQMIQNQPPLWWHLYCGSFFRSTWLPSWWLFTWPCFRELSTDFKPVCPFKYPLAILMAIVFVPFQCNFCSLYRSCQKLFCKQPWSFSLINIPNRLKFYWVMQITCLSSI